MTWDASPELMAEIRASIEPVETDGALRQILAEDFPKDCLNLPITGGWGYTKDTAVVFVRELFTDLPVADFVALEYHIAQKIIYEELIIFRPKDYRFSDIAMNLITQELIEHDDGKVFDHLKFSIACWADWHWEQLKQEWEENDFGRRPGFDSEAHHAKRAASRVIYEREFWFDISSVFGRASG